jgi:IclR family transcriptional regulator, KDG regulon repressor
MSSVANVFGILEAVIAHQARGLAYSEVVAKTRVPKATAHRLLKSLVRLRYLRFDPENSRYFGDLKIAELGSAVVSAFDLAQHVHPHLLALHARTGHACHLGILDGSAGVYLDKIESAKPFEIKLYSAVGKRFPLHCTAMGKVLLASLPIPDMRRLLGRKMQSFTPATVKTRERLEQELEIVRASGFAVDREEITRGIMCVAAPVVGSSGAVVGAISVGFPASIARDAGITKEIRAVRDAAKAASDLLGGSPQTRPVRRVAGQRQR